LTPEQFVQEFNWSLETFEIALEARFQCVYCGHKFFESVDSWTQFNVDHLRPGSRGDRDERPENKVVACWTCNKIKASFDPGADNPNATKTELIRIAGSFIKQARLKRKQKVEKMQMAAAKFLQDTDS